MFKTERSILDIKKTLSLKVKSFLHILEIESPINSYISRSSRFHKK